MNRPDKLDHIPRGYMTYASNCGIKDDSLDLGVVYSTVEATAAAIFTQNAFVGEPIKVGRDYMKKNGGRLRAIVVNSKNANVATFQAGYQNTVAICEKLSAEMGFEKELVLPSSTGVIGRPLPAEKVIGDLTGLKDKLADPPDFAGFARAIMTTDTFPKFVSAKIGNATLLGVAKGSGMIEPNMATMLSYFFTDAKLSPEFLDRAIRKAANLSFNNLSVDSDTSTSDTLVIMANGLAGEVDEAEFQNVFNELSIQLTRMLARDGEGATKLFIVDVTGAKNDDEARKIGKSIINSPLVKTMIYRGDPNWGRIFMAVGKTPGVTTDPEKFHIAWGPEKNIDMNAPVEKLSAYLKANEELRLTVDIGVGEGSGRFYGCDYTEDYVKINAYYTT